jgi:hypothetical protein
LDPSPGLTIGVGPSSALYSCVQVPQYQKLNGIQRAPRHALAMGWTSAF